MIVEYFEFGEGDGGLDESGPTDMINCQPDVEFKLHSHSQQ